MMKISQPVALHQVMQGSIIALFTCYHSFIYTNIVLVLVMLVLRNILKHFSDFDDEDCMIKEGNIPIQLL